MIPFLILEGIFLDSSATDKTQTNAHLAVFKLSALLTKPGPMHTLWHSSCISLGVHKTME
jgi:hypothetical protein